MEKRLISCEEAAEYLGIGKTLMREFMQDRGCPFLVKLGSRRLVDKRELDRWIDEKRKLKY